MLGNSGRANVEALPVRPPLAIVAGDREPVVVREPTNAVNRVCTLLHRRTVFPGALRRRVGGGFDATVIRRRIRALSFGGYNGEGWLEESMFCV